MSEQILYFYLLIYTHLANQTSKYTVFIIFLGFKVNYRQQNWSSPFSSLVSFGLQVSINTIWY